jgi:hypothetical protein
MIRTEAFDVTVNEKTGRAVYLLDGEHLGGESELLAAGGDLGLTGLELLFEGDLAGLVERFDVGSQQLGVTAQGLADQTLVHLHFEGLDVDGYGQHREMSKAK